MSLPGFAAETSAYRSARPYLAQFKSSRGAPSVIASAQHDPYVLCDLLWAQCQSIPFASRGTTVSPGRIDDFACQMYWQLCQFPPPGPFVGTATPGPQLSLL
jgi:hypothetical protein